MGTIGKKINRFIDMKQRLQDYLYDPESRKELHPDEIFKLHREIAQCHTVIKDLEAKPIWVLSNDSNDWWLEAPSKLNNE